MNYDELLAEQTTLKAELDAHCATREATQQAISAAIIAAAKQATGKAVRSLARATSVLGALPGGVSGVTAPIVEPWVATESRLHAALDANKKARREAAREASFSPVEARREWKLFATVSTSSYRSQGYGCAKYTREAAQDYVHHAARHGVRGEVRDVALAQRTDLTDLSHCDVYVLVAGDRDVALLHDKPDDVPLREWVRLCWKRGVNPRVYNPYLPHGYEEQNGLDFFGGERCAARGE